MSNALFELHTSSFQGSISSTGQLQVKTVCLDELIAKGEVPAPDYLKIDVEGAEVQVLAGAKSLLTKTHPTIFLATHGDDLREQCYKFLTAFGYQILPIGGKELKQSDEFLVYYK